MNCQFSVVVAMSSNKKEEEEEEIVGDATTFVIGISGVRKLQVSENTIEVLDLKRGSIPQFMNLTQLQIKSFETMGWGSVPKLLRNCPSLEELIIQGLFHMTGDGCGDVCLCSIIETSLYLLTSPVKVLTIYERGDVIKDRERFAGQVRHFLLTMPNLQQVVLYGRQEMEELLLSKKLPLSLTYLKAKLRETWQ
ncbi:unnamed protein product [Thlaspi arvense]|uniref:FBD domain-containing protein n=1 Tax=Thlaspi arvense TaxID=13288 RepID=A0AAU9S1S6_THLAR|nr:unnamed protein product [Thlaspi arvense]